MTIILTRTLHTLPVVGLLCLSLQVRAQSGEEQPKGADEPIHTLKVNGEFGVGVWSSNRLLDDRRSALNERLTLTASADLADHVNMHAEGWAYHSGNADDGRVRGRLRDGYLRWDGEETEIRVGPQIIAWGRADRINPTDNLTARDYTAPFATDEEQRYGAMAVSLSEYISQANKLNFIVKKFHPSVSPNDLNEQRFGWRPQSDDRLEYAAKLDHTGDQFDWSMSYFNGREKLRSLQVEHRGPQIIGLSRGYAPMEAIGTDGVYTMGSWGLRGEFAHLRFKDTDFSASAGRLSHWFGVIGTEKNLDHNATLNVQYYFRYFSSGLDSSTSSPTEQQLRAAVGVANNQLYRYQDGISLRYAQRLWNDRIDYEIVALINSRGHDYALRPRLNIRYSDRIKFALGADGFRGSADSYFGSLRKNSVVFADMVFVY